MLLFGKLLKLEFLEANTHQHQGLLVGSWASISLVSGLACVGWQAKTL
jgi:hypothetical protein